MNGEYEDEDMGDEAKGPCIHLAIQLLEAKPKKEERLPKYGKFARSQEARKRPPKFGGDE